MHRSERYFEMFCFTFKSHLNWAYFLKWPIWAVHFKYRGLLPTSLYQALPACIRGLMHCSVRYFEMFCFTFKSHLNWTNFLKWPIRAVRFKYRGLLPTSFYFLPALKGVPLDYEIYKQRCVSFYWPVGEPKAMKLYRFGGTIQALSKATDNIFSHYVLIAQ